MSLEEYGYDKERFLSLTGEAFDCIICSQVVKNPKECTNCGSMFCGNCIDSWLTKRRECPNRCQVTTNSIRPIGKALMRIYSELDVKCMYYDDCKTVCKIIDLEQHEKVCKLPKCSNFEICGNRAKPEYEPFRVCDTSCLLLTKIREAEGDWSKIYQEVRSHMKDQGQMDQPPMNRSNSDLGDSLITAGGGGAGNNRDGPLVFQWDNLVIGTGINLTENNTRAFLKEGPYMFRTVIGNQPFYSGVHYWELQADPRTENELKIGVTIKRDINMNTAFCDFEYGWAYYGLGQLRHSSNASGVAYGKKFKKEGVLGIFLDMNRGILSFSLNGEYFGEGFKNDALKKGPIWPAVSLLHCAGCKLITGKPAPQYFLQ